MKIYIAIWEDHHADTTAHPFTDRQKSIDWAISNAKKYCQHEEDYKENYYQPPLSQWIFCVDYSCESDRIFVVDADLRTHQD